jgi:2-desacetyl-2-hydroxyethyl bacteriochlorophyllide A dehydrogenase
MKAAVLKAQRDIRLQAMEKPEIKLPTDAIIQVTLTSICGTDLHPYRGHLHFSGETIMGHEFIGTVAEVGNDVRGIKPGDKVVASCIIACGSCWYCKQQQHYQCEQGSLFGYDTVAGAYYPGGQAEYVRVPFADQILFKVPSSICDEDALFVGDILSTGFGCTERARIQKDECVVILGAGPVGLMAAMSAKIFQPAYIFVVEPNEKRKSMVREIGAIPVDIGDFGVIRDATVSRGADCVIEAVGIDETLNDAMQIVRPGGRVIIAGSHHSKEVPFNAELAFAKEISFHFVVGNPIKYAPFLLEKIADGTLNPAKIITHRCNFNHIKEAYRMFEARESIKAVIVWGDSHD